LEHVDRITSFTSVSIVRSQRVMQRIGLRHELDFDHPRVPDGHPVRPHVLYVADRQTWMPHSVLA
jgi:RimJ/RimL family protein N-acetyltransferase